MRLTGDILLTRAKLWRTQTRALDWFKERTVFFALGMGRSGTNFLARLLGDCPEAAVFHEPIVEDLEAFVEAFKSTDAARRYLDAFRVRRMYDLVKDREIRVYGEVNSALRYHAPALKAAFPDAKLMHLVRDGRDVVRSVMSRHHYMPGTSGHLALEPLPSDHLYTRWPDLSRFEKVCWLWADANRRLSQDLGWVVKFEELIGGYDYFRENVNKPFDLEISPDRWRLETNKPRNITKAFSFPPWTQWDRKMIARFDDICGGEMARLGYS
jgi:hypothetical protein